MEILGFSFQIVWLRESRLEGKGLPMPESELEAELRKDRLPVPSLVTLSLICLLVWLSVCAPTCCGRRMIDGQLCKIFPSFWLLI